MRTTFSGAVAALALVYGVAGPAGARDVPAAPHLVGTAVASRIAVRRAGAIIAPRSWAATLSSARVELLALINAERARAGVPALRADDTLDEIAEGRSRDMIARHYFSHYMPGGGTVFDVLDRHRVPYVIAGENLATNNYLSLYPLSWAIEQSNADLMRSPGHRANLLEPRYRAVGLGLAVAPTGGVLVLTEVFVG